MKIGIVPKILLDTNVILETFLGREPTASRVRTWIENGTIAISAVSVGEITSKASKDETEKLELLISKFGVLPVDVVIAKNSRKLSERIFPKREKSVSLGLLSSSDGEAVQLQTRNAQRQRLPNDGYRRH